ncbi:MULTISPECIES: hypothetical protein [unclassified Fusibacter]|uniref:DUF7670 domain-containing protein n=1 Tax=unclassified Fusibacter TaxID=2624464 RepID=UPI00101010C5|nr:MULTISPECIES: hypothetical protein [unclassified Fusibacter]MCK8060912.1 hypothetical protein [Fusibacter sp. A2]NPE23208.1 hypothetical protein [Fusibacter sp. A1]RXV59564.1 hypothetical protein DWB64_15360 [Fusibacter sp. A1]
MLSIALIGLLLMLSFDVFEEGKWTEIVVGFFMHNLPTMVLAILTYFAWKRPLVGAFTFLAGGLIYLFVAFFFMTFDFKDALISSSILSLPALLTALLYYLDWKQMKKA